MRSNLNEKKRKRFFYLDIFIPESDPAMANLKQSPLFVEVDASPTARKYCCNLRNKHFSFQRILNQMIEFFHVVIFQRRFSFIQVSSMNPDILGWEYSGSYIHYGFLKFEVVEQYTFSLSHLQKWTLLDDMVNIIDKVAQDMDRI